MVKRGGSFGLGGLTWRIVSFHTAQEITDAYLDATARGIYMIVEIAVTNDGETSAAGNDVRVTLELGGTEYGPDQSSVNALDLAGHKGLVVSDLRHAGTVSGWTAFDVPRERRALPARICFSVLAAPSGEGCIATT
jgi:hypothetical protein